MKKSAISLLVMTALLGSLLTACSDSSNNNNGATNTNNPPITSETPSPSPDPTPSEEPSEPDGSEGTDENTAASSTDKIVNEMIEKFDESGLMDQSLEVLEDFYRIDSEIVDEFTLKTPAFNLIANEIGVIKVKDAKDIELVKTGMEQRAEDVQKMFENYLPGPYKNAQNYKIATKGNYVLFVISENADGLEKAFLELATE